MRTRDHYIPADGLSSVEFDVLILLLFGNTRKQAAATRGVTPSAISHVCKRLERKGHKLPPTTNFTVGHPAQDRAAPLFAAGMHYADVAAKLGVSTTRAWNLKRLIEKREAAA